MTLHQRIYALCREQGRTVSWLRGAVGITPSRWRNLAHGHATWRRDEANAIARRLHVPRGAIWPADWEFVQGTTKGGQPRQRRAKRTPRTPRENRGAA